jgi:tripartite-type tricarboxylate transporter receptor subunit TctC
MRTAAWLATLAIAVPPCAAPVLAQDYPNRPVRVIVPLPPAGAMDVIVRGVTQRLAQSMNQNFIIDNRPGAGGAVALEIAAGAPADGYTLVSIAASSVIYPLFYKSRVDVVRDLAPVSQISAQGYCVVVHPSMPARTAPELVKLLKASPGKYHFGSSGVAGAIHLTGELFMAATGTKMIHVPYKGTAMAYTDLVAGNIEVGFPTIVSALPHVKAGRIRGLAATTPARSPAIPELPTLAETGIRGVEVVAWYGMLAPAGTPRPVIHALNAAIAEALKQPEMVKRLRADGSEAVSSTPEEFRALLLAERDKWSRLIKQAGIKPE